MKICGLDLDNNPLAAEHQSLKYALNVQVGEDNLSYRNINDKKLLIERPDTTIVGIIPTNIGFVLFGIDNIDTESEEHYIEYYELEKDTEITASLKQRYYGNFNFNKNRPITGEYTYNYKKELIISFTEGTSKEANETRIINITNVFYDSEIDPSKQSSNQQLTDENILGLNLIPNIIFPSLNTKVISPGNLKTGAYQVGIKFKNQDGSYTDYSTLTPTIIIQGNYDQSTQLGININRGISVSFIDNNISIFTAYRLCLVYKDEESNLCYETNDIVLNNKSENTYTFTDTSVLSSIVLEDVFIKSIKYIKDTAQVTFLNRLYRGNVSTYDYKSLDDSLKAIASRTNILLNETISVSNNADTADLEIKPNFQAGENYCFFIGFYDYKGYLINIYNIPCKLGDFGFGYTPENSNYHRMPYPSYTSGVAHILVQYSLKAKIQQSDIEFLNNNNIKSYSIFFVEHNYNNSRVLSTCPCVRDMVTNNLSENQTYEGLFDSNDKVRVYPYEYMFNNSISLNAKILKLNSGTNFKNNNVSSIILDGANSYFEDIRSDDTATQWKYPMTGETIEYRNYSLVSFEWNYLNIEYDLNTIDPSESQTLDFIACNNSQLSNQSGESYFRGDNSESQYLPVDPDNGGGYGTSRLRFTFIQLINTATEYYKNIDDQKLQIASVLTNINEEVKLQGDGYIGVVTLRLTAPTVGFRYGDTASPEADSNFKVWRWIITYVTDSKFNLNARFDANAVDISYKEGANSTEASRYTIYDKNYAIDNLINNEIGKGYSLIYNNNGSETFAYGINYLNSINDYINRVIRSSVNSSESTELGWRYYGTNDYKDIDLNRGKLVSLKTNSKHLYIQQEYGLKLISVRDTLGTSSEGQSYVSSSDIFDMDPVEILYSPTGYIGCSSQFDTIITINGYYVIDGIKGKIFQVDGTNVREISSTKCKRWFETNLLNHNNNPFATTGRFLFFNEDYMNLYVIQNINENPFNIHYNTNIQRWISFEEFENSILDIFRFTTRLTSINVIRDGNIKFYIKDDNKYKDAIVKMTLNDNPLYNKLLEVITWKNSISKKINGVKRYYWDRTISELAVHNEDQCTGYLNAAKDSYKDVKWYDSSKGANKIGLWKFNDLHNIAQSNLFLKNDITFDDNELDYSLPWFDQELLYGQYFQAIFKYSDTSKEYMWELQEVIADYSLDNRNQQSQQNGR